MTVGGGCDCGASRFVQSLTKSFLKSLIAESRLDFPDIWLLMPLSTELSLRFRRLAMCGVSVVVCLDHGNDLAISARVSRRQSFPALPDFAVEPPPPHSLTMSVNWARLDLRRRWFGGDDSCVSFGGDIESICAAESLLPVPKKRTNWL